jgi:hypothetical protein
MQEPHSRIGSGFIWNYNGYARHCRLERPPNFALSRPLLAKQICRILPGNGRQVERIPAPTSADGIGAIKIEATP